MSGRLSRPWCVLAAIIVAPVSLGWALELHVHPDGNDGHSGAVDAPLRTLAGAHDALLQRMPATEPITVWIHGGRYAVEAPLIFDDRFRGTAQATIRIRAVPGETPVIDGGTPLAVADAALVQNSKWLDRLAPAVRGRVYGLDISDSALRSQLASRQVHLSLDGRRMSLARYPNRGFAHIDRIEDAGAVYAHGRTQGEAPSGSFDQPIGAIFSLENKDIGMWQREFDWARKAFVSGYLSYDWYRERHAVAWIRDGRVRLMNYSRYGVLDIQKIPRRLRVYNLLAELDAGDEYYVDSDSGMLFFLPGAALEEESQIKVWGGTGFAEFKGAAHVRLEGLVLEGFGPGPAVVHIRDGDHIGLAGCTIRNSACVAVRIDGGTHCGLQSCDVYDVPTHLVLNGGDRRSLRPAHNYAENCHFTQIEALDEYGGIQVRGVGNRFRHNLVHHFPGQVMTVGDNDHLVEANEFFNIGFQEGDGGALYSGAQRWSWGNVYRYNFFHHLMCVPQAHPRGGIYPDDGDAGDAIINNVFYKAAHRAVLINGGAGHTVQSNLFLRGHIGIYNTEIYAEKNYAIIARYDAGELKRGDKMDHIWRTEQVVGPKGWNQEPWVSRYPLFSRIMNQERMRFYPIECVFTDNRFAGNFRNIEYRVGSGEEGVIPIEQTEHIRSGNNLEVPMNVFRGPEVLDFSTSSADMPRIPFERIGLRVDAYRTSVPDPDRYRAAVRKHFAGRKSYDPDEAYDPATINRRVYFNSGVLLRNSGGLLHGPALGGGEAAPRSIRRIP